MLEALGSITSTAGKMKGAARFPLAWINNWITGGPVWNLCQKINKHQLDHKHLSPKDLKTHPKARDVHQLVACLPSRHKALRFIHKTTGGTGQVETGGSGVQSHPQLHSEFETSLNYVRLCLRARVIGGGAHP